MLKGRSRGTEKFFARRSAKQNMRSNLSVAKRGEQRKRRVVFSRYVVEGWSVSLFLWFCSKLNASALDIIPVCVCVCGLPFLGIYAVLHDSFLKDVVGFQSELRGEGPVVMGSLGE